MYKFFFKKTYAFLGPNEFHLTVLLAKDFSESLKNHGRLESIFQLHSNMKDLMQV